MADDLSYTRKTLYKVMGKVSNSMAFSVEGVVHPHASSLQDLHSCHHIQVLPRCVFSEALMCQQDHIHKSALLDVIGLHETAALTVLYLGTSSEYLSCSKATASWESETDKALCNVLSHHRH